MRVMARLLETAEPYHRIAGSGAGQAKATWTEGASDVCLFLPVYSSPHLVLFGYCPVAVQLFLSATGYSPSFYGMWIIGIEALSQAVCLKLLRKLSLIPFHRVVVIYK